MLGAAPRKANNIQKTLFPIKEMGLFWFFAAILRHSAFSCKKIYMPFYKKSFAFPPMCPYIKSTIID